MQDSQILSIFQDPASEPPTPAPARVLVFDACHVGVVLRTVLFVELVVGVGAMYGAATVLDWLTRLALLTGGALPAALVWLILACMLKTVLARLGAHHAGCVRYAWRSGGKTWLGATPETLVQVSGQHLATVALATGSHPAAAAARSCANLSTARSARPMPLWIAKKKASRKNTGWTCPSPRRSSTWR